MVSTSIISADSSSSFLFFIKTNKKDLLINEDFNDVFIQSPITTGVLRLDQDSNSNSSDEIGL